MGGSSIKLFSWNESSFWQTIRLYAEDHPVIVSRFAHQLCRASHLLAVCGASRSVHAVKRL